MIGCRRVRCLAAHRTRPYCDLDQQVRHEVLRLGARGCRDAWSRPKGELPLEGLRRTRDRSFASCS